MHNTAKEVVDVVNIYKNLCLELVDRAQREKQMVSERRRIMVQCLNGFSATEQGRYKGSPEFGCWAISRSATILLIPERENPNYENLTLCLRPSVSKQKFEIWQQGQYLHEVTAGSQEKTEISLSSIDVSKPITIYSSQFRKPKTLSDSRQLHWWLIGVD